MANEQLTALVQGRIVWVAGDLFTGDPEKIYGTNQPKIDPKTGKQNTVYRFGLAVPKANLQDPEKGQIWQAIHTEAHRLYPSGQVPPGFAWKYKDGDGTGIDDRGQAINYALKEGYAGHIVFTLSTNIQPRFFRWENGQNMQVIDGIKCGDYVNVQVKIGSQMSAKPGLYLNPMAIQLVAPGKEIINAPTGDQIFGAPPPPPQGYVPPAQPVMPPMAAPVAPPPPPAAPAPHYGVIPPAHQPPAGGVPMGNVPAPAAYPAQAVGATPMPAPIAPPIAMNAAVPGAPSTPSGFPVPGVPR